ncbi:MAG TPA: hypothetical protein VJH03_01775 [Blastocatellia bacterium]|nr:hypothetical protein [Blastocatellia bacterium]
MEMKTSAGPAPVAIVAALDRELGPLRSRASADLALIVTGEGAANVDRKLREWLRRVNPRAVIGLGFAGALSESLRAGDLIVVTEVRGSFSAHSSPELAAAARKVSVEGVAVHHGVAISVDRVVCEAAGKRALAKQLLPGETGCVDMESAALARVCAEFGVPVLTVRAITDLVAEDLPVDFNRCRSSDGRVSELRVVTEALLHPRSIKGLLELRRRSRVSSERLALFVERLLVLLSQARSGGPEAP